MWEDMWDMDGKNLPNDEALISAIDY